MLKGVFSYFALKQNINKSHSDLLKKRKKRKRTGKKKKDENILFL